MSIFERNPITLWGKALTEKEAREMARQYKVYWLAQVVIDYTGLDDGTALTIGKIAEANPYGDSAAEAIVDAMWNLVDEGELNTGIIDKFAEEWRKAGRWR